MFGIKIKKKTESSRGVDYVYNYDDDPVGEHGRGGLL
jgi:hypothetical protein